MRAQRGLAAQHQDGSLRPPQVASRFLHACGVGGGRKHFTPLARGHSLQPSEQPPQMPADVGLHRRVAHSLRLLPRLRPVPGTHQLGRVQEIDGTLHEDRPRHSLPRQDECLLQHRDEIAHARDPGRPFHVGAHEGHLVDVLERAPAAQHRRRGSPQHHHRRLGHLRVLHGGDRVRGPGAGGHGGHPRHAGEPGHRVRGKDRRRLVPHVDDPHAPGLGCDQDGGNVAAAEGEEEANPLLLQDLGDPVSAGHHLGAPILQQPWALQRALDRGQ